MIIDEWDIILREDKDNQVMIDDYIKFLRSVFRSKDTPAYLAGAYMTGILPIIRYNTQSALSDFRERTMLKPLMLARYVGFTKDDVPKVCEKFGADERLMKVWYDGYRLPGAGEVYCPSSVMEAAKGSDYSPHWANTAAMESLTDYIYLNIEGLGDAMNELLDGKEMGIDPEEFENRLDRVDTGNIVLTVLVHLGYLAYDYSSSTVRIPNLEVRLQMLRAFAKAPNKDFVNRTRRCEKVLAATRNMDAETVASLLEDIHNERPPIHYNDEHALRYIVLQAFNNSPTGVYVTFDELSSGRGFVDILFMSQKGTTSLLLLVELKNGASTGTTISQIEAKDYIDYLRKVEYSGEVLLIGINYSPSTRKHTCRIEKITLK